MMRVNATVLLVAALAAIGAPPAQTDLSGEWTLASATTSSSRDGATGELPTKTYLSEFSAFNCGRACRIVYKGSTLTVENAQLKAGATSPSPTVTIVVDGRPHTVVDSITLGNTIETVGRWEGGTLLLTSMLSGSRIALSQTISLDQNQLVVVKSFVTSDAKFTLRYTRK
jgi:hypothetical protein